MNFTGAPIEVALPSGVDALTGEPVSGRAALPVNGFRIVRLSRPLHDPVKAGVKSDAE